MSPEQTRGEPLDKRTDTWSFGVVVYECLTGQMLFRGETTTDSMAAILHRDPDWSALPVETPLAIRLLLRRCLQKSRKRRLHDIADARIEFEDAITLPAGDAVEAGFTAAGSHGVPVRGSSIPARTALVGVVVLAALAGWLLKPEPDQPPRLLRKLDMHVAGAHPNERLWPVISPDGTRVAYVAGGGLWIRPLHELEPIRLPGTDDAQLPFWSPDSSQIGFYSEGRLWRTPVTGGTRTSICTAPDREFTNASGAVWLPDGRVVFTAASGGPLWEVRANGGRPTEIINPASHDIRDFHNASALPDGSGILTVLHREWAGPADAIVIVRDGAFQVVHEHPGEELWTPTYADGFILYGRIIESAAIWAVPYSLETRTVSGMEFLVAESADNLSVSDDGTLVFGASTDASPAELVWADRSGEVIEVIGKPRYGLRDPHVSPDGAWAAVGSRGTGVSQLWLYDLGRGTTRPFDTGGCSARFSSWLSDSRLAYNCDGKTFARAPLGSDSPEQIFNGPTMTISDDLRFAAVEHRGETGLDLYYYDLQQGDEALPLITSGALEDNAAIRPGSGWLAYKSTATGRSEIYVMKFPSGEDKRQVSLNGGGIAHWNKCGDELFFQTNLANETELMAVAVTTDPELQIGERTRLFGTSDSQINLHRGWSVSPDGQRILGIRPVAVESETRLLTVIENWHLEFAAP